MTPTASPRPSRRSSATLGRRDAFDWLIVALFGLSALVFIEPAPFDLLIVLLLPIALVLRRLAIPNGSGFSLACVGLFLLANAISLVPAEQLPVALRFAAITVYLIVAWAFVLGLVGKYGERAIRNIMLGWTIGAVLSTLVSVAAYFFVLPLYELVAPAERLSSGRWHGFFKDANVFGAFLVAPAVWASAQLFALERSRRVGWAIALLLCSVGIFLSYSRGAWISLAIALPTFFALRVIGVGTRRSRLMTLLAIPIAIALLAVALERLTEVAVIKDTLELRLGLQAYDSERFSIQRRATELALRSPIGIGPGQTERVIGRAAHQAYVRGFLENGYLGGLALAGLLIGSLLRAIWLAISVRDPRLQAAMAMVAASLAAVCVESFVIDSVHWRHLWVLAALAWTPSHGVPSQGTRSSTRSAS